MAEDITVAPDLLAGARRLFDPGELRALNPLAAAPRVHVDARLPAGRWHVGAPVEGPCRPGERHPGAAWRPPRTGFLVPSRGYGGRGATDASFGVGAGPGVRA